MADIDVQRKSSTPIWPWILGLVLLALIIGLLATQWRDDDPVAVGPTADTVVTEQPAAPVGEPAAVRQFAQACVARDAGQQMGLDHNFTINCLRQLADAIDETAQHQGLQLSAVQPQTQEMREHAQQIDQLPAESLEHSNHARLGAMAGVAAMQTLNQAPGAANATAQVGQAEQAAQSIVPTETLLNQSNDVNRYFQQAHDALQTLATGAGTRTGV